MSWSYGAVLGLVLATVAARPAEARPAKATGVSFQVARARDGKKYPNPVRESYQLAADGTLRYTAYFHDMPIDLNHNDDATWNAGAAGKRVFDAIAKVAKDLVELPDDQPPPAGGEKVYLVGFTGPAGDTTRYAADPKGKAWRAIDPAFRALIESFEKATGRPRKPEQLPQR